MNWKLILQLSLFGLIMAFGTISLIPAHFEFIFWLAIFVFCAYIIAKQCTGSYFLHGFLVSVVNCFWISVVHFVFYQTYIINHPDMVTMNKGMPASLQIHPRLLTTISGLFIGLISAVVLGLFAFIASKIVKGGEPKAAA
jgi:hypothetical protein